MKARVIALLSLVLLAPGAFAGTEKAVFAGGCFWCMEAPFAKIDGVTDVTVGYAGGKKVNPTYEEVSSGETGHAEAVQVTYDPAKVSYDKLLDAFWMSMDPTDAGGQFYDRGTQYRTAIFYTSEEQKKTALASKEKLDKSGKLKAKIVTEVTAASKFYPAEDYHQHYYQKNPIRYGYYRSHSGRDQFIEKIWGKAAAAH